MLTCFLISALFISIIRIYMNILRLFLKQRNGKPTVALVVIGDIGRSPRMLNHAISLTENGYRTIIFGFNESKPSQTIIENTKIINVNNTPLTAKKSILFYLFKFLWLHLNLFISMFINLNHNLIIVQNPPSIPSFLVVFLISIFNGAPVIIDWHNYGHTILACNTKNRFLIKFYKLYELVFGRLGSHHLCVSKSMMFDLEKNWGITAHVVYDRPPTRLMKSFDMNKEELRTFLVGKYGLSQKILSPETLLLVSSTSWTADEDFSILINALDLYEINSIKNDFPEICCIITGKGPLREFYLKIVADRRYTRVSVTSVWLEAEDYISMLRSADIGVCLHTSSSGLDLPMKVVDMFTAELIVMAYYYPCIEELVVHDLSGFTFKTDSDLAELIMKVSRDVDGCRSRLRVGFDSDWETQWDQVVLPIVRSSAVKSF